MRNIILVFHDKTEARKRIPAGNGFPQIVIMGKSYAAKERAFYCLGTRERGQVGLYEECVTENVCD